MNENYEENAMVTTENENEIEVETGYEEENSESEGSLAGVVVKLGAALVLGGIGYVYGRNKDKIDGKLAEHKAKRKAKKEEKKRKKEQKKSDKENGIVEGECVEVDEK